MNSIHLVSTFKSFLKRFSITFSSNPDARMDVTKSAFFNLRFLPFSVSASSSVSSGITNAVDSMSYAGVSVYTSCWGL